jgi:hypothetical protein
MVFPQGNHNFGKRIALCIVFIFSVVLPVVAQQFSLGVKAGPLALKSVYGDKDYGETIDDEIKYGFYAAGIISFPLKKNYSCVIEGGYSRKGRNVKFGEGNNQNQATYRFVDAALLLRKSFKFYLGKDVPADWFVNVGPHISYWLGGEGTVGPVGGAGNAYTIKFTDDVDLGDFNTMFMTDANRWLFGLDIGVGMEAPITKTQRVMAELRFTWGHTYYGGASSAYYPWIEFTDTNMKANEKVLCFTLAYMFDIDLKKSKTGKSTKDKETHRKPVKKKRR